MQLEKQRPWKPDWRVNPYVTILCSIESASQTVKGEVNIS